MMRKLLLILLFVIGCGQKNLPKADNDKLLYFHNVQREENRLKPFVIDEKLNEYAQKHSEWMVKKNSMTHSRINSLLSNFSTVGENIAYNQKDEEKVTEAWMNSPGHRANILNKRFTKIGFGMARNSFDKPYWTTVFAD